MGFLGCNSGPEKNQIESASVSIVSNVDADAAGYAADEDCDDNDPTVNPGAQEVCDEVDNDCNGQIDERLGLTFYADSDDDGYGNPDDSLEACLAPQGITWSPSPARTKTVGSMVEQTATRHRSGG